MKTIMNFKKLAMISMVIITLFNINVLQANHIDKNISIIKDNEKTFSIYNNNAEEKLYAIKLVDRKSTVLYQEEELAISSLGKRFNLKNLPNGIYLLEIEDKSSILLIDLEIIHNELNIMDQSRIVKPVYIKQDKKVKMILDTKSSEDTEIKVYDENNELLYNQDINDVKRIKKTFDFSKVVNRSAYFIIRTIVAGRPFEYYVSKN